MTIGMNLGGIEDWSTDWVFVDQFKMARTWMTRTVNNWVWDSGKQNEIPLDANGWPTQIPFTASDGNQHYVHTIMPAYVSGTYTVIVDGAGQIQFQKCRLRDLQPRGRNKHLHNNRPFRKTRPNFTFRGNPSVISFRPDTQSSRNNARL